MSYVALYRRWRPSDFDALVGQDTVKQALTNALEGGHIAHAYLFAGPRGTGKTSTARILAKALNCDRGPTAHPCGECRNCLSIAEGSSLDVLEIDAASNRGIDSIKELRDKIAFAPVDGRYKVYVIDEVHMLTAEASNALLKTLEEPPANVVFILATTDPQKVIATIHSRCQRFDFHRVTADEIVGHLAMVAKKSDIVADEQALWLLAVQAEGGMRDALSLLDQCAVMNPRVTVDSVRNTLGIVGREAIRELVGVIGRYDGAGAMELVQKILAQGREPGRIMLELSEYLRALLLYHSVPKFEEIYLVDDQKSLAENSGCFSKERIMEATEYLAVNLERVRYTLRPRVFLELAVLHLCQQPKENLTSVPVHREKTMVAAIGGQAEPAKQILQSVQKPPKREPVKEERREQKRPPAEPRAEIPVEPQVTPAEKPQPRAETKTVQPAGLNPAKIWDDVVGYVVEQGKRAIGSCAKNGKGVAFDGKVLTVLVQGNQFVAERLAKDDYRRVLEEGILAMQRVPVHCEFVTEFQGAVPVWEEIPLETGESAGEPEEQELPETVKKALDAFGGELIKK